MELYIFAIVICAGIGALVGQRKHRATAGFLWGAAIGPLGWLLIALGPDAGRAPCPHCGEPVKLGGTCCKPITWIRGRPFKPSRPA